MNYYQGRVYVGYQLMMYLLVSLALSLFAANCAALRAAAVCSSDAPSGEAGDAESL